MPAVETFAPFRDVVRQTRVRPLALDVGPEADRAVRDALARSGLLVLGECHGVAENPLIIQALMQRFEIDLLALEWRAELREPLERFLRDGRLDDHAMWWTGDGRVSAEHLAVLKAAGFDSRSIALIDPADLPLGSSWSDRDQAMARAALASATGKRTTLIVAGNAHTPLIESDNGRPMGAWLAAERPGVREVVIDYRSGGFFNFGDRAFAGRLTGDASACLRQVEGRLVLRLPRATPATVPFTGTAPGGLLGRGPVARSNVTTEAIAGGPDDGR